MNDKVKPDQGPQKDKKKPTAPGKEDERSAAPRDDARETHPNAAASDPRRDAVKSTDEAPPDKVINEKGPPEGYAENEPGKSAHEPPKKAK